jgi:predicted nucleotidyltransferase
MLEIFNKLSPFLEDNYIEIGVREYSRLVGVSPPCASDWLKRFENEQILVSKLERNHLLFRMDRNSSALKHISLAYWSVKLMKLVEHLSDKLNQPDIWLFGSLTKLETRKESDIDLFVNCTEHDIDVEKYEDIFNRKVEIHFKESYSVLEKNIRTGIKLS